MTGKLTLIGCGPGAADLLTLRAIQRIKTADLILYDRLVDPEVLSFASSDSTLEYVGKGCGDGGRQQVDINARISEALSQGLTVARLKSGGPMVFGRGSEELAIAVSKDAEIEIVPGVTSALAAASEWSFPITERAELQSFVVTTGKSSKDGKDPDWCSVVRPGICAAFYMSVAQSWRIQTALMAKGVPGSLQCDWIENAGKTDVRHVSSRLDRLAMDAREHAVKNPAILLIRYPLSAAIADTGQASELA